MHEIEGQAAMNKSYGSPRGIRWQGQRKRDQPHCKETDNENEPAAALIQPSSVSVYNIFNSSGRVCPSHHRRSSSYKDTFVVIETFSVPDFSRPQGIGTAQCCSRSSPTEQRRAAATPAVSSPSPLQQHKLAQLFWRLQTAPDAWWAGKKRTDPTLLFFAAGISLGVP